MRREAGVAAVGVHLPGVLTVIEEGVDDLGEFGFGVGVMDGAGGFDSAREVAIHPVGRADQVGVVFEFGRAIGEAVDAGVFEESPDDRADGDVFAHVGDSWAQAAEPADDQVDLDACVGSLVEGFDDLAVFHRVHLGEDMGGFASFGVGDLVVDTIEEVVAHVIGRDDQAAVAHPGAEPGDHVEEPNDIGGDFFVGGQEPEIGVALGGAGVVVARAHVGIGAQPPGVVDFFASDD